jgi:hypothetical protein
VIPKSKYFVYVSGPCEVCGKVCANLRLHASTSCALPAKEETCPVCGGVYLDMAAHLESSAEKIFYEGHSLLREERNTRGRAVHARYCAKLERMA